MLPLSTKRYRIATDEDFQDRVLVLALGQAHDTMNLTEKDEETLKLQAKATELINQPEQAKEKLALSVAARLIDEAVEEYFDEGLDDELLGDVVGDVLDALAGVPGTSG